MGSAAPATQRESSPIPEPDRRDEAGYVSASARPEPAHEPKPQAEAIAAEGLAEPAAPLEKLQTAVLQALTDSNQRILVSMLSAGEWSVQGNELVIKIAESQTVIDMSLSNEARRIAIATASGVLGRAVKLKLVPGSRWLRRKNATPHVSLLAPADAAAPNKTRLSAACKKNSAPKSAPSSTTKVGFGFGIANAT